MLALRVPSGNAEKARLLVWEDGILDKHHRILSDGGRTDIPLLARPAPQLSEELGGLGGEVVDERDYEWRETFKDPLGDILAGLDLPEAAKRILPARWEQLGRVLVLKMDPKLEPWKAEIAAAYAKVLQADTVLRDTGGIAGKYREPVTELLLGTETETVHVENHIRYRLDAARLMFSSGNVDERIRMAHVCRPGEVVVDMFAGIGYFTLPMAVHSEPRKIIAHEINPLAFEYLRRNAAENGVSDVVEPVLGNCLDAEEGVADRIVMGYVGTTHEYLPKAMRILRGKGIIHYHETCPNRLMPERPVERVAQAAEEAGKDAEIMFIRRVKSYSPGVEHVVVDAKIG